MMAYLLGRLMAPLEALVLPEDRLFWGYLFSAVVITQWARGRWRWPCWAKLKLYFFPKHVSVVTDYRFFCMNRILFGLFLAPLFAALEGMIAANGQDLLNTWAPLTALFFNAVSSTGSVFASDLFLFSSLHLPFWCLDLALTVLSLLAMDGAFFLSHQLQHRIPALWAFHQVHHSAERLTPVTAYRVHPVDDMLSLSCSALFVGSVQAVFAWITQHPPHILTFCGLNAGLMLFYILGFNLRHSSAWIHYGPFWSQWLISPAQHQIHHSLDPRHFDKNFGFIFAVWDRVCGTLFIPQQPQRIRVGLYSSQDGGQARSVWNLYSQPFIVLWSRPRSKPIVLLILFLIGEVCWVNAKAGYHALHSPHSVFLEELSSPVVKESIAQGYDTLLIPTGGVEQNGAHLALGKHNSVVRYTSEQIAKRLGHTLVAPLIPIVPEGRIHPATGHMQWSGTLGLAPQTYEALLSDIATHAQTHGFRYLCFIGEHGESQISQQRVATQLNLMWSHADEKTPVTSSSRRSYALQVDQYYQDEEQHQWLMQRGESADTIGHHAGIIDTSELMAVAPHLVWLREWGRPFLFSASSSGSDGDPTHASMDYGKVFLDMKIQHAVSQIQSWKAQHP